ncbi:MAG: ATP-binding cassette domain-containing protein [Gemmatimonadales bacterium]|nr:ATP-binding cassette domain-containing protein [Gemmatimonadales bacterium]
MEILVEGLRFARDRRPVLDIPALRIASGGVTAIFGPNGSGKTTLLRLIAGLERADAGTIWIGPALVQPGPGAARAAAIAFQEPVFLRGTVRRNLDLAMRLRNVARDERAERIGEVARECGIEAVLDRSAWKLSGGEARRAGLARVLALRAPVTLLDEPLAGIDRIARTHLLDDLPRLLARFATTTVLVTHDREEAFRLADDLVILTGGTVRAAGPKGPVHATPTDAETAELLGYTVLFPPAGPIAVPPGGLRVGDGELGFDLAVERAIDMGNHLHLLGTIAGRRADLRLPSGTTPPAAGTLVRVFAASHVALRR